MVLTDETKKIVEGYLKHCQEICANKKEIQLKAQEEKDLPKRTEDLELLRQSLTYLIKTSGELHLTYLKVIEDFNYLLKEQELTKITKGTSRDLKSAYRNLCKLRDIV